MALTCDEKFPPSRDLESESSNGQDTEEDEGDSESRAKIVGDSFRRSMFQSFRDSALHEYELVDIARSGSSQPIGLLLPRVTKRKNIMLVLTSLVVAAVVAALCQMLRHYIFDNQLKIEEKPILHFRRVGAENGSPETFKFKILQIADIHLGEEESTDWGPKQDRNTFGAVSNRSPRKSNLSTSSFLFRSCCCSGDVVVVVVIFNSTFCCFC